jgi:hypothetical protein
MDGYYSAAEKDALVACCDCYVSLHRSEGLGLTMAEAMAAGKPVIATGYSGNMQFMTAANSFLVDYVMTPVARDCEPYPENAMWADPDTDHAADLMRKVYAQPREASAKGQRARAEIFERHSVAVAAEAIGRRLQSIRANRRNWVSIASPARSVGALSAPPGSLESEALEIESTLTRLNQLAEPRITVEGRAVRTRAAMQRGLFRLLRPFLFQHQQLHAELLGVLSKLARGLHEERNARAAADKRIAQLAGDVTTSMREISRLDSETSRARPAAEDGPDGRSHQVGARIPREFTARREPGRNPTR